MFGHAIAELNNLVAENMQREAHILGLEPPAQSAIAHSKGDAEAFLKAWLGPLRRGLTRTMASADRALAGLRGAVRQTSARGREAAPGDSGQRGRS